MGLLDELRIPREKTERSKCPATISSMRKKTSSRKGGSPRFLLQPSHLPASSSPHSDTYILESHRVLSLVS